MLIWLSSQTCTSVKRNMNAVVTTGGYNIWNYHFFFLNGPTPASFCLCSFFSNTIFTEKNYRLQRGSNSERLSTRRERWPLEHHNHGPNFHIFLCRKVPQVNCTLSILKYFMRDNERQTYLNIKAICVFRYLISYLLQQQNKLFRWNLFEIGRRFCCYYQGDQIFD